MNPSSPLPNPSFTFLPPNQKSSLSYTLPQPIPQHPPSPDLPTAFSALDHLIHLAQRTIHSISTLIPIPSNEGDLVPCPFNSHHRIPPESLFRHSLLCPAPLDLGILLDSLSYPHTLKSSAESQKQNRFVQTLNSSDAELCFSLDHCDDFGSSFFFRDCPGVVSLLSSEQDSSKKTFTLPAVLSVECANFVSSGDKEIKGFGADCLKLLPSELWAVRGEIEAWNDYPNMYSFSVLKVILCTWMVKESDLMRWVIANSPRYGIVIDVPMRDHIFLLFKLCLKAIVREAFDKEVKERNSDMNFRSMRFNCPVLGQILKWLASQLSVLYGEPNGKFFAINMFKQCVSNAASGPSLFLLEQKVTKSSVLKEVSLDADVGNIKDMEGSEPTENGKYELTSPVDETIYSKDIFVSQVAAAAAALHERSLLEEKIKGLRFSQPRTRYQIKTNEQKVIL